MSIQLKHWLGFGLLIVLFSGLGLYQSYQLGKLGEQSLQAFDQPLTAVDRSWAAWDTFSRSRRLVDERLARIQFADAGQDGSQLQAMQQQFKEQLSLAANATAAMALDLGVADLEQKAEKWYALNLQRIGAGSQQVLPDQRALVALESELHKGLLQLVEGSITAADMQKQYTAEAVKNTLFLAHVALAVTVLLGVIVAIGLAKSLTGPLHKLLQAIRELSHGDGDLTRRLAMSRNDELGQLGDEVDLFVSKIHGIVSETHDALRQATQTLTEVGAMAQNTQECVVNQKERLYETAVEVEQMTAAVESVSERSNSANEQAQLANSETKQGLALVSGSGQGINRLADEVANASQSIQELSDASESITELLVVIESIADQTNLLALNAAIEAARAGEAGRGFSVVADEVRSLALKTRESTEDIQQTVKGIQERVQSARGIMDQGRDLAVKCVDQSEQVSQALMSMSASVVTIEEMNHDIADEVEQQRASMSEINSNVENINRVADETTSIAQQLQEGRYALERALQQVESRMSQFKL